MSKPPPAVEVVLEAVMCLLTGRILAFSETRRVLSGGEAFLQMLRDFRLDDVTDGRLRLIEPYVDNPVFKPENVLPVSYCASKFCAWVLGVVQVGNEFCYFVLLFQNKFIFIFYFFSFLSFFLSSSILILCCCF